MAGPPAGWASAEQEDSPLCSINLFVVFQIVVLSSDPLRERGKKEKNFCHPYPS